MSSYSQDPYKIFMEVKEGVLMHDLLEGTITSVDGNSKTVNVTLSKPYYPRNDFTDYGKVQETGYAAGGSSPVINLSDVPIIYNCRQEDMNPSNAFREGDTVMILAVNGDYYCAGFKDEIRPCEAILTIVCWVHYPSALWSPSPDVVGFECFPAYDMVGAHFFIWNASKSKLIKLQDDNGNEIDPPYHIDYLTRVPEQYRIPKSAFNELDIKYWEVDPTRPCPDSVYEEVCSWVTEHPCSMYDECVPPVGSTRCMIGSFTVFCMKDNATPYIVYDENDPSIHGEVIVWGGASRIVSCSSHCSYPLPMYCKWTCPLLDAPLNLVYESDPNNECKKYPKLTSKPFVIYTPNTFTQIYSVMGADQLGASCGDGYSLPLVVASSVCKSDMFKPDGTWNYDIFSFERNAELEAVVKEALLLSDAATAEEVVKRGCDDGCSGGGSVGGYTRVPYICLYDW